MVPVSAADVEQN